MTVSGAPSAESGAGLLFGDFLEYLRHEGFEIDVGRYLRLQHLLGTVAGECAPSDLKTIICPVFARDRREQEQFYAAFDSFYAAFGEPAQRAPDVLSAGRRELFASVPSMARRRRIGAWLVVGAAAAILGTTILVGRPWLGGRGTGTPSGNVALPPGAPATPNPAIAPPPENVSAGRWTRPTRFAVVVLPLALLLIGELVAARRRRLNVRRERAKGPPFAWPLPLPARPYPFVDAPEFRGAARLLRQRQTADAARLDLEATISATVRAGGYPSFRFRSDTRPPEYLLLVDRAAPRDHHARFFTELAAALRREGVHTTELAFDGDPRILTTASGERTLLTEVRRKLPAQRLIIVSEGDRILDPVSGAVSTWAAELLSWPDRALLTPTPLTRWAAREFALARHFVVLPATLDALAAAVERFQTAVPAATESRRTGAPASDGAWERGDVSAALRRQLGDGAFRWLCACALYPELHWDLTLFLGTLPALGVGVLTEANLLRLARLPWFRAGSIPDEARLSLSRQLHPRIARSVQQALLELLERYPPPRGSVASDQHDVNVFAQRLAVYGDDWLARWRLLREGRRLPRSLVVRDVVLLRVLKTARVSPLGLIVPRALQSSLYRQGLPVFGLNTAARGAMAVVAIIIGLGAVSVASRVRQTPRAPVDTLTAITAQARPDTLPPPRGAPNTPPSTPRSRGTAAGIPDSVRAASKRLSSNDSAAAASARESSVSFGTTARGARYAINGQPRDTINGVVSVRVPRGNTRITISAPACTSWDTTVVVSGDVALGNRQLQCGTGGTAASAEIRGVVRAYAVAIESRDVDEIRRAFPGVTPAQVAGWTEFFRAVTSIRATLLVDSLEIRGDVADARLSGTYEFVIGGKPWQQPVFFTGNFRHDGNAWRLAAIDEPPAPAATSGTLTPEQARDTLQLMPLARRRDAARQRTVADADLRLQTWRMVLAIDSTLPEARRGRDEALADLASIRREKCVAWEARANANRECFDQPPASTTALAIPRPSGGQATRVDMWVLVAEDGRTSEVRLDQSGNRSVEARAAEAFARAYTWRPAMKNAQPAVGWIHVGITVR